MEELSGIIAILFTVNMVLLAFLMLLENREPEKTLGWLLIFVAFPIVGFLLYLFFGHNWHNKTYADRRLSYLAMKDHHDLAERDADKLKNVSKLTQSLRYLATSMTGFQITSGNDVKILTDAQVKYPRLFDALKRAKASIDMEYFIFRDDRTGNEVMDILKAKARDGVRVRFLVDGMGSFGFGHKAFRGLREAGVEARYFAPVITPFYFLKVNYRDHRKIVNIDNEVVFSGGINIGNEYLGESHRGPWRDTSIELRGPAVAQFAQLFEEAWERTTRKRHKTESVRSSRVAGGTDVNVIPSGPDTDWPAVQEAYLAMIHGAQKSIKIQTPYFIPDESILEALKHAALRGVNVELMVPRYPDARYLYWVANTYVGDFLRAGGHVYEYTVGFLHPKVVIADEEVACLGTCNIDIRSFRLDFEVNILVSEKKILKHVLDDFANDMKICEEVEYLKYIDRPIPLRIRDSIARLIAPLL